MDKKTEPLGRLKSLGIDEEWKAAFYLPNNWLDFRFVLDVLPASLPSLGCFTGNVCRPPEVKFGNGAPRMVVRIRLDDGSEVGATFFGDTRNIEGQFKQGAVVTLHGSPRKFDRSSELIWLESPVIVSPEWSGRLLPVYSGKRSVIAPATVRERILPMLKAAIPEASRWIRANVRGDVFDLLGRMPFVDMNLIERLDLNRIILCAHQPDLVISTHQIEMGQACQHALESLASLHKAGVIANAQAARQCAPRFHSPSLALHGKRAYSLPFKLTVEQKQCVDEILVDLASTDRVMHRVLSGEVGSGKTAVYGLAAAAVIDGGGTSVILIPNTALAIQVHREISDWWPDLNPALITNDTKHIPNTRLLIGTSALLFRDLGEVDFLIVDEQQKFSREQREKLLLPDTHLLEVSATCIPRSQALVRYGAIDISKLTGCHVEKDLRTMLWGPDDRKQLMARLHTSISNGSKLLVVYPKREAGNSDDGLPSVEQAFEIWNRLYPSRVRMAHGGLDEATNKAAISDVSEGHADILISTTVVEVGITIPGLRHLLVVHAERLGLMTLHQLRGRLSRDGGVGHFDMLVPTLTDNDRVMERLSILTQTTDGFEIAEFDMRLRGFGDLSSGSDKQTGSDDSFLIGRVIDIDAFSAAVDLVCSRMAA